MKDNENIASVIRELQDYVIVRKEDYANMICAWKTYNMDKVELENKLRVKFEAEYAYKLRGEHESNIKLREMNAEMYQKRIKVLEDRIAQLEKKNLKWWQKIF